MDDMSIEYIQTDTKEIRCKEMVITKTTECQTIIPRLERGKTPSATKVNTKVFFVDSHSPMYAMCYLHMTLFVSRRCICVSIYGEVCKRGIKCKGFAVYMLLNGFKRI